MITPTRTRIRTEHCSVVLSGKFGPDEVVAIQAIRRFFLFHRANSGTTVTLAMKTHFYILSNALPAIYCNSLAVLSKPSHLW